MTADLRTHLQSTLGDGFTLEREIVGGGMSRVYVAEETALRRRIVVKVLPSEMAAAVSLARFQREIALAARLQHPHIVPLLAAGETQGLPYYTMPFIDGESLRERLTRAGELPVVEATRLVREIASALAYAHEKGIVHRDIKPENVLLSGGIALVADFGVAKALLASSTAAGGALTSAGVAVGTPAYMSPEQVTADPSVDHRADLYALGMIAYEMLAGQPPFAGRSMQALLSAHVVDAPEPLERRRPAVPLALAAVVMRCLEKRPADRPQSASEIIQALDALTTPTHTVARRVVPRRLSRATLAVLALLVVVAAGGSWWSFGRRASASTPAVSRLLIAPFENLTGEARFDHLGRMVADQLSLEVAQGSSMQVVPSNIVLMALRDTAGGQAERLRRLSDATHATLLVSGSIVRRGDSLAVQGQVTDVRRGTAFVVLDPVTGPASDPTGAVRALGDRLLGALASRELTILSQRGYRPPTNAAYQEFAKGWERFIVYGDFIGSRPFFERAIALDPTYTGAYQLLGRQYLNAGEYARADSMVARIERLPQGLSAAERLQTDYTRAELNGDIAGLLKAQQKLVATDSNSLALELLGEAAMWMLRPDLAIPSLERAGAAYLLMGSRVARGHVDLLADAYHLARAHARELRAVLDQQAIISDALYVRGRQLRAYAGLAQGGAAALAVADSMVRESSDSSGVVVQRIERGAQEFRAHGDTATASQLLEKALGWIAAHPSLTPTPNRQLWEGIALLAGGMLDSATVRFASVARDTNRLDAAGYLALTQVARGDRARARAAADSLGAIRRRWMFGQHTFWRAAIMGALGDHNLAVELLRQAHREGQRMHTWHYHAALDSLHGDAGFEALVRPRR